MKVVVQRVKKSSVTIDNKEIGSILKGLTLLVCFMQNDTSKDIDYMVHKIINLRIFEDENKKMNKSILDIKGSILSISQFTLAADIQNGNRPSFGMVMSPKEASSYFDEFNKKLSSYVPVECGVFGADMQVNIINDGPVTIIIDS